MLRERKKLLLEELAELVEISMATNYVERSLMKEKRRTDIPTRRRSITEGTNLNKKADANDRQQKMN